MEDYYLCANCDEVLEKVIIHPSGKKETVLVEGTCKSCGYYNYYEFTVKAKEGKG